VNKLLVPEAMLVYQKYTPEKICSYIANLEMTLKLNLSGLKATSYRYKGPV